MAVMYRDGMSLRSFCGQCGCKVDGTLRQWGIKWVRDRKCGHGMQFMGYIDDLENLRAKGWTKSFDDLPPDPRIESKQRGIADDKIVEQKEIEEFERRKHTHTNQKFHSVGAVRIDQDMP